MAAFNDVDGIPMHAHRHLLRDVLKGEWGFDGVVVADWNGIGQLVDQGVAEDLPRAARRPCTPESTSTWSPAPTPRTSIELVGPGR